MVFIKYAIKNENRTNQKMLLLQANFNTYVRNNFICCYSTNGYIIYWIRPEYFFPQRRKIPRDRNREKQGNEKTGDYLREM